MGIITGMMSRRHEVTIAMAMGTPGVMKIGAGFEREGVWHCPLEPRPASCVEGLEIAQIIGIAGEIPDTILVFTGINSIRMERFAIRM